MEKMNKLLAALQTQVSQSLAVIEAEAKRMDETASAASGGKAVPITMCTVAPKFSGGYIHLFGPDTRFGTRNWRACAKAAREQLEEARKALEAQHQENIPLLANNERVRQQVTLLMTNLGIQPSRVEFGYATPRAKKMTAKSHTAGYVEDLRSVCKTSDGYDAAKRTLDEFEKRIERYEAEEAAKEKDTQAKAAREQREREKLVLLGAMAQKYGCNADFDSLIDAMGELDKYFGLAYALERNRQNWSEDGPDRAAAGLNGFKIESDEDQAIYDSLNHLVENWEGDGRVFRDTRYNYTVLYGMVKHEGLMEDFAKLEAAGLVPTD